METSITYTSKTMFLSTDERWLINRILRFKESRPDDVEVIKLPEENDGCLYCKLPANWMKITPPASRVLTDQQKAEAAERLRISRQNKAKQED